MTHIQPPPNHILSLTMKPLSCTVNMELFTKESQEKQRLLFDAYFRIQIVPNIDNITIPDDIMNLCYDFYEINIISLLNTDKEITKYLPSFKYELEEMTQKDCQIFARLLRDKKQYFIAYDMISWILKSNPCSGKLHNILATILQRWCCYIDAENEYKKAIQLEPHTNGYKYNFGILLEKEEKYDLALQQFLNASKADQQESEYIFEAAYCYQMLKDFDNATLNFLKSIEMKPNRAIYYEYYAIYLCQEFDKLEEAAIYFEKSIDLEPNRWQSHYSYGRCLRDYFKDYTKSKQTYLKSLELNSTKGFIYGSFGYLLYLMAQYKEARKYINIAIDLEPNRPFSHYYNSLLQRKEGYLLEEADKSLNIAIDVTTIPKAVIRIVQRMKKHNPTDIEYHRRFEILLRAKVTAMTTEIQ